MNIENTYREAITKYGIINQLDMAVEECAELIQAINKVKRYLSNDELKQLFESKGAASFVFENKNKAEVYYNICDEIADVQIMLGQLVEVFNKTEVNFAHVQKLTRLMDNLKKQY